MSYFFPPLLEKYCTCTRNEDVLKCVSGRIMNQRKESVKTDFLILGDEAPQYVTKLSKDRMSTLWTHQYKETLYPFSQVLRLRVLQVTVNTNCEKEKQNNPQ
ncbi:unnamed protein product [Bemisia tabaci]|uniref:Uncharacterized protein n=1 Tax=Bemisia tabaci TaxID=7038 RepID=A0A9P0ADD9_BEMTA|nr:unnamed protein product [Bemisia tabaci]